MQVHERMSTIPRGQLCLLLGDFDARVGNIAADCFGRHAPVTENQNGERMRELLTGNNMVALNTSQEIPTLGRVSGKPATLDYICASSQLRSTKGHRCQGRLSQTPLTCCCRCALFDWRAERKQEKSNPRPLIATLFMTNGEFRTSRIDWSTWFCVMNWNRTAMQRPHCVRQCCNRLFQKLS